MICDITLVLSKAQIVAFTIFMV